MACERKRRVVLAPRQALFLHGADRHAVDDERGGRVVVVGGDAEDLHVSTGSSATCVAASAIVVIQPGGSRRSARLASHANGGSTTKYMTGEHGAADQAGDRGRDAQIPLPQPLARARQTCRR